MIRTFQTAGSRMLRSAKSLRRSLPLVYPRRVSCNVCDWQGSAFLGDGWHEGTACPWCRSGVRHRLLMAALTTLDDVSADKLVAGRDVLHFAPEPSLEAKLRRLARTYRSADLTNRRRDVLLDICDMSPLADACLDLVLACDVLEHVPDDCRALSELARVLRPGGWAILTVPQKDNLAKTFQDPTITDPAERERAFGQSDHLRIYGHDFSNRVEAAGFTLRVVAHHDFADELIHRHVLAPPHPSSHPLATNFRRVFFAQASQRAA